MHMLLVSELKGRAHEWLHANGTRILEPVADARRLFESRIWSANESFVSYFDEKARLHSATGTASSKRNYKVAATGRRSKEDFRCYNCNSKGHMSKDCKKPDRVPGSCFGCDDLDHWVVNCPLHKEKLAKGWDELDLNALK
ncbi:zinc finger CCHC domain-containing protein 7-like [Drosophila willistoni]|uniref:zinc finger CCHC domain-containing protein 7-like n=1 Tax=Drosophila willistoni TaxID=7260 RepID=UPI001F07B8B1|nr:zinc finger CCHC domain-containing protein 7-like [Drosophila willistoni]